LSSVVNNLSILGVFNTLLHVNDYVNTKS